MVCWIVYPRKHFPVACIVIAAICHAKFRNDLCLFFKLFSISLNTIFFATAANNFPIVGVDFMNAENVDQDCKHLPAPGLLLRDIHDHF